LKALGMPTDILDPTLPTSWNSYASLQGDTVTSIVVLLEES